MRRATIYLIDYWVPFPASEYGGLVVVLADNDAEAERLCIDSVNSRREFSDRIADAIINAKRIEVETDDISRVVELFTT